MEEVVRLEVAKALEQESGGLWNGDGDGEVRPQATAEDDAHDAHMPWMSVF